MRYYGKFYFIAVLFVVSSLFFFSSCIETQTTEPASFDPGALSNIGEGEVPCNTQNTSMTEVGDGGRGAFGGHGFHFNWDIEPQNGTNSSVPWSFYTSETLPETSNGIYVGYLMEYNSLHNTFTVNYANSHEYLFRWVLNGDELANDIGHTSVTFETGPASSGYDNFYRLELHIEPAFGPPCPSYYFWVDLNVYNVSAL